MIVLPSMAKSLSWTPWFPGKMVLLSSTFTGNRHILIDIWIILLIMKLNKVSAASTLLFRAANLPSTCEGKARETSHVTEALKANGYPPTVISNILKKKSAPTTPPPEELVSMFFKWADPSDTSLGFACLPYIRGLTEPLTRLLRKNYIRVVSKPAKTLQQEFPFS